MNLLSALLGLHPKRPARNVTADARDARDAERHDAYIPVSIGPRGRPQAAGLVINLSPGGAAIRVHGWNAGTQVGWLTGLNQGDEMRLAGLLHAPMSCWVVVVDEGLIRVHFSPDEAQQNQLCEAIERLAPA